MDEDGDDSDVGGGPEYDDGDLFDDDDVADEDTDETTDRDSGYNNIPRCQGSLTSHSAYRRPLDQISDASFLFRSKHGTTSIKRKAMNITVLARS